MKKNNIKYISFILVSLVLLTRLLPHAPNFTPIISVILFSAMYFTKKSSWVIPFIAILVSDLILGFSSQFHYLNLSFIEGGLSITFTWLFILIYLSFVFIYLFCKYRSKLSPINVLVNSFVGSVLFFILSNFAVWITGGYPMSFSGLIACYAAAIPFFKNTLLSTLLYSAILFTPIIAEKTGLISSNILSENS